MATPGGVRRHQAQEPAAKYAVSLRNDEFAAGLHYSLSLIPCAAGPPPGAVAHRRTRCDADSASTGPGSVHQ